jgi:hypothetical protein
LVWTISGIIEFMAASIDNTEECPENSPTIGEQSHRLTKFETSK